MVGLNLQRKMSKYEWKIKSLARGINPDLAVAELERIENVYGSLTPEIILNASEPVDAILHDLFEWNDSRAAHNYRLQQARTILNNIEVKIISDGGAKNIPVYEVVTVSDERRYKHIQTLTLPEVAEVKAATVKELTRIKEKLSFYKDFNRTIEHLDSAIDTIT